MCHTATVVQKPVQVSMRSLDIRRQHCGTAGTVCHLTACGAGAAGEPHSASSAPAAGHAPGCSVMRRATGDLSPLSVLGRIPSYPGAAVTGGHTPSCHLLHSSYQRPSAQHTLVQLAFGAFCGPHSQSRCGSHVDADGNPSQAAMAPRRTCCCGGWTAARPSPPPRRPACSTGRRRCGEAWFRWTT